MGPMTANILDMDIHTVATGAVSPYPGNARVGDTASIATSLETNGQYRPLVVQKSTGYILAGNHTHAAAQQLGWDHIAVQYVDVDENQARRILLADNKTNDAADYDTDLLAALLSEVHGDPDGTGYSEAEIDAVLDAVTADLTDDPLGDPTATETPAAGQEPTPAPGDAADDDSAPHTPTPGDSPEPEGDTEDDEGGEAAAAPAPAPAAAEMVLAFTTDDRNEAAQLIAAARTALGDDVKTTDIVLRALRTLTAATDARYTPEATISVSELLHAAQ